MIVEKYPKTCWTIVAQQVFIFAKENTMANLKLVFTDNSEVAITTFSLPLHITVLCDSRDDALAKWSLFTTEQLASCQIQDNGETQYAFADGEVTGVQYMPHLDGTVTAHFYLNGTKVDSADEEYAQAAKIMLGEV